MIAEKEAPVLRQMDAARPHPMITVHDGDSRRAMSDHDGLEYIVPRGGRRPQGELRSGFAASPLTAPPSHAAR